MSTGLVLGSMVIILIGCELFTNAVEHIGRIFKLSHHSTGSTLAAVGTALPESSIPIIAVFFGSNGHGEAVGVGAILGAPFMLATLALALVGLVVFISWATGRRKSPWLSVNTDAVRFEFKVFMACFVAVLLVSLLNFYWLKQLGAILLVLVYIWYAKHSLNHAPQEHEVYTKVLYLERMTGASLNLKTVVLQLTAGLAAILAGAKLFITAVIALALCVQVPALVLSLLLAPLATELPEKYNSVAWVLRGQDTLAISNITGAMVFQSMLPVAFGFAFTQWSLGTTELLNIAFSLGAVGIVYISLSRSGLLKAKVLLVGGILYLAYLARVIWLLG